MRFKLSSGRHPGMLLAGIQVLRTKNLCPGLKLAGATRIPFYSRGLFVSLLLTVGCCPFATAFESPLSSEISRYMASRPLVADEDLTAAPPDELSSRYLVDK